MKGRTLIDKCWGSCNVCSESTKDNWGTKVRENLRPKSTRKGKKVWKTKKKPTVNKDQNVT